jgi:hypothetical protein
MAATLAFVAVIVDHGLTWPPLLYVPVIGEYGQSDADRHHRWRLQIDRTIPGLPSSMAGTILDSVRIFIGVK